jgi:hypothetical protein
VQASNRRIKYAYEALVDFDPAGLLNAAGIMANPNDQERSISYLVGIGIRQSPPRSATLLTA